MNPIPRLTMEALLEATPLPNAAVRVERGAKGARVFVPRRRRWFMRPPVSWVLPVRPEMGLELDELGLSVLEDCDGQRTVEAVIERFADRYRVSFHEARVSVSRFLYLLVQRNVIALAVVEGGGSLERSDSAAVQQTGVEQ